jgi:inner membrane protein
MDTVTQALFGAAVAQAGFRRSLGRPAILAGAVLGVVPDLDVVAGWFGPFANWVHHRGITHSLFFAPVAGPPVAWGIWRLTGRSRTREGSAAGSDALWSWIWLSILVLVTHPVIDVFTSYGTQLLAPFSRHRFAIDAMPIIDPVYSLPLLAAVAFGAFARRARAAATVAAASLFLVAGYTALGWSVNERVEAAARAQLAARGADGYAVRAYPLLFQPWYRRVVATGPDEVLIGFHSVLAPGAIGWRSFPDDAGEPAAVVVAGMPEGRIFRWFAMDQVHWRVEPADDGGVLVEATDLRYGMPGTTELGFWGIRTRLDAEGRPLGPPEVHRHRPDAGRDAWAGFLRATFLGSGG